MGWGVLNGVEGVDVLLDDQEGQGYLCILRLMNQDRTDMDSHP
jgi:hypothetical protein